MLFKDLGGLQKEKLILQIAVVGEVCAMMNIKQLIILLVIMCSTAFIASCSGGGGDSTSGPPAQGPSLYCTSVQGVKKLGIDGGAVTNLTTTLGKPFGLAIDSTSVYWTSFSLGTLNTIGKNGGAATELTAGIRFHRTSTPDIAVDATSIYWIDDNYSDTGKIQKIGLNGGAVTTLASGLLTPKNLVMDESNIYWVCNACYDLSVFKVGKNGGTVTKIVINTPAPPTPNSAFWPVRILVDTSNLYWSELALIPDYVAMTYTPIPYSSIKRQGLNGGTETTLASGLLEPGIFAEDSVSVYWTEYEDVISKKQSIKKVGLNGGAITTLVSGLTGLAAATIDDTDLYYTISGSEDNSTSIQKVGLNGGAITHIATGLPYIFMIARD